MLLSLVLLQAFLSRSLEGVEATPLAAVTGDRSQPRRQLLGRGKKSRGSRREGRGKKKRRSNSRGAYGSSRYYHHNKHDDDTSDDGDNNNNYGRSYDNKDNSRISYSSSYDDNGGYGGGRHDDGEPSHQNETVLYLLFSSESSSTCDDFVSLEPSLAGKVYDRHGPFSFLCIVMRQFHIDFLSLVCKHYILSLLLSMILSGPKEASHCSEESLCYLDNSLPICLEESHFVYNIISETGDLLSCDASNVFSGEPTVSAHGERGEDFQLQSFEQNWQFSLILILAFHKGHRALNFALTTVRKEVVFRIFRV